MNDIRLTCHQQPVSGLIELEGSKSISNRLLIIRAISGGSFQLENVSPSDDSKILQAILEHPGLTGNVHAAGTTMRFLTAYYASRPGEKVLTGSDRMKKRPIGILVEALRSIGADIHYAGTEGFPPLHIAGKVLEGGSLAIRADVSSQFISALLLCAPGMKNGLELELLGEAGSLPYIKMTLEIMRSFGIDYSIDGARISVPPGRYIGKDVLVESDWSAASYFFSIAAISSGAIIAIKGLFRESLQGDYVLTDLYRSLGVSATWQDDTLLLQNTGETTSLFSYNFSQCPDLAQTVAVSCAALGIPARLSGLESLRIKESDRTAALSTELKKFGVDFTQEGDTWVLTGKCTGKNIVRVETYEDHRMAMSFAPLAVLFPLEIAESNVVKKSYPSFWEDLERIGFSCSPS